jgi:hypothetical protein
MGGKTQAAAAASGGLRVRTARAGQQCRQNHVAKSRPATEEATHHASAETTSSATSSASAVTVGIGFPAPPTAIIVSRTNRSSLGRMRMARASSALPLR